jgi:glycosyltransferase involved in cell wall biosynthesis
MIRPKGVHVLVEAQRRLAFRGVAVDLALYGKTDADNTEGVPQSEIEGWTQHSGGGHGRVVWHGHVSDIGRVWANADIAVLPAITREGMPRAVLEAAASGRPLVVTDVPGCRHFVRDGVEGLIVPPSDPDALAAALARLAADPGLRARMGDAARARVLSGYTIGHVTAGVREAYAGLLGSAATGL